MDGRLIIANERVETAEKLVSENPATLAAIGEVSLASPELCDRAIAAAKAAYPAWRSLDPRKKRDIFRRAENILARRATEAGRLIAMEKGSPYPESLAVEVFGALQSINYYGHTQGRPAPAETGRPPHPVVPQQVGRIPLPSTRPDPHHFALELSFPHSLLRHPQRPDGGQHGRPEAVDVDAVRGPAHRRGLRRGRAAAGRPQRRRLQDAPGRGHDRRPRHPDGHVHRQRRHRQAHHGALQPEPDQPDPRARRQGPDDRPRRRRPRAGGQRRRLGGLHELRPELRLGRAGLRRAAGRRRLRRRASSSWRALRQGRRSRWTRRRRRRDRPPPASSSSSRSTSPTPGPRAPGCRSAASASRGGPAISSSRRS